MTRQIRGDEHKEGYLRGRSREYALTVAGYTAALAGAAMLAHSLLAFADGRPVVLLWPGCVLAVLGFGAARLGEAWGKRTFYRDLEAEYRNPASRPSAAEPQNSDDE